MNVFGRWAFLGCAGLAACQRQQPVTASVPEMEDNLGRVTITATSTIGRRPVEPTLTPDQVDSPARVVAGSGSPIYPDSLRVAAVQGEVRVRFVVDRKGKPDMATFRVIRTTHPEFADAVLSAMPYMAFVPAQKAGREVRQVVQQTFRFAIAEQRGGASQE